MRSQNNQLIINYVGLGAFLWLAVNTSSNLFDDLLSNLLMYSGINPILNFWICNALTLTIFILSLFWAIRYLKNKELTSRPVFRKLLIILIIIFTLTMAAEFFLNPLYQVLWISDNRKNWSLYYDTLYNGMFYSVVDRVFYFLRYLLIGLIIIRKIKDDSLVRLTHNPDIIDI